MAAFQHPTKEDLEECDLKDAKVRGEKFQLAKWISLKDKVPDEDIRALVSNGELICVSDYIKNCEIWRGGFIFDHEITHWMPLPKPPSK